MILNLKVWSGASLLLGFMLLIATQHDVKSTAQPTFRPSQTPTTAIRQSRTPATTPTVGGTIISTTRINVREGPGREYNFFSSLAPGNVVQIIGQDSTGAWLNIRMEDGREGWIESSAVYIMTDATLIPDLTAVFLGTPASAFTLRSGTTTPTAPPSRVPPRR